VGNVAHITGKTPDEGVKRTDEVVREPVLNDTVSPQTVVDLSVINGRAKLRERPEGLTAPRLYL
jgi:hypothetical protein